MQAPCQSNDRDDTFIRSPLRVLIRYGVVRYATADGQRRNMSSGSDYEPFCSSSSLKTYLCLYVVISIRAVGSRWLKVQ